MKYYFYFLLSLTIIISAFRDPAQRSFQKVLTNDHYNYIAINNIKLFISNNGIGSHDPNTDGSGLYWQEGAAIFEDGLLWGGKIQALPPDTQSIRVNGNTFRYGLQAGKILQNGKADDYNNSKSVKTGRRCHLAQAKINIKKIMKNGRCRMELPGLMSMVIIFTHPM